MSKPFSKAAFLAAVFLTGAIAAAKAEPGMTSAQATCGLAGIAAAQRQCVPSESRAVIRVLPVRDVRSAGSGKGNGCWNACFNDFDECMGVRQKNLCVSSVKTCLETCDRLSNRPGM